MRIPRVTVLTAMLLYSCGENADPSSPAPASTDTESSDDSGVHIDSSRSDGGQENVTPRSDAGPYGPWVPGQPMVDSGPPPEPKPFCGNGRVEAGEECDPLNRTTYPCTTMCRTTGVRSILLPVQGLRDAAYFPDGGFVLLSDQANVHRFSAEGAKLWSVTLPESGAMAIAAAPDGTAYLTGNVGTQTIGSSDTELLLGKVDAAGTVAWTRRHNIKVNQGEVGQKIELLPNGTLAVVGGVTWWSGSFQMSDFLAYSFDANGTALGKPLVWNTGLYTVGTSMAVAGGQVYAGAPVSRDEAAFIEMEPFPTITSKGFVDVTDAFGAGAHGQISQFVAAATAREPIWVAVAVDPDNKHHQLTRWGRGLSAKSILHDFGTHGFILTGVVSSEDGRDLIVLGQVDGQIWINRYSNDGVAVWKEPRTWKENAWLDGPRLVQGEIRFAASLPNEVRMFVVPLCEDCSSGECKPATCVATP